ncbi:hypothetical protein [Bosea sp. NBC_00550]|uniref:hypothetical protein n=1 Tax=Bosea sp. NBC_00550 TaxID=2969621 RepID=UPI00222E442B|nr:hypothetical protein [Bosea sp. NBC_00550]UZF94464.1 hypothetical protein NWE53_09945 [Bosea sp. NBC_00550]
MAKRPPVRNPRKSLAVRPKIERAYVVSGEHLGDVLQGKPVPSSLVAMLGGEPAPDLLPGWQKALEGFALSEHDLAWVHRVAQQFCWERASLVHGTTHAEVGSLLKRIRRASGDLVAALDQGEMAETWRRLEKVDIGGGKPSSFRWEDVHPVLLSLAARARQAVEELKAEKQTRPPLDPSHSWRFFVTELAAVFERRGEPVTASKPSEKSRSTPFTQFAWAVMQAVPKQYRQHDASRDAMADAISNVLADLRTAQAQRPGAT